VSEEKQTDESWLAEVVSQVTRRPCVVEFVPSRRSFDFFMSPSDSPAHWRVVIKGVDAAPCIDPARVTLRDDEHVKRRILSCLPEAERVSS